MIKAKVVSFTLSKSVDSISRLDLETYLEDPVVPSSFYGLPSFEGLDVVVMTKEEYKALDLASDTLRENLLDEREKTKQLEEENKKLKRENNEKEGEICKLIVNNDIEQLRLKEKIRKLKEENEAIQKDIKDLEEKLAQEAAEIDIHPDGTIVFKKKRVSELEKEVEKLKEENKALKEDKFTMKITGGLFYKED